MNSDQDILAFFEDELAHWELARINFDKLKKVQTRNFQFENYNVTVQFNPDRIRSSSAKIDSENLTQGKCFLCKSERNTQQHSIDLENFELLVNPYPIFPQHFTIAHKQHLPQQIEPYFVDFLNISKKLHNYVVFYNGAYCGASMPDHLHFQAGTKTFLPLIMDYHRLKKNNMKLFPLIKNIFTFENYGRKIFILESDNIDNMKLYFDQLTTYLKKNSIISQENPLLEPLLNVLSVFENETWTVFVIPRKTFRPWQYFSQDENQLLISPATVEMSGLLITPIEKHFQKITKKDIISIYEQVSFTH